MTFKTIIHNNYPDQFLHMNQYFGFGTSSIPVLYPLTSNLEGVLNYEEYLTEEDKNYIIENYKMVLVSLTTYNS